MSQTSTAPATPGEQKRYPTIVCIDDDPHITQAIGLLLTHYEVNVVSAYSGEHGIWETLSQDPDLVITDLRMPQGSGELVVECLKTVPKTGGVPVIVLTGRREPHLKRMLKRLGAAGHLQKPVNIHDLLEEIGKHIELRKRDTPTDSESYDATAGWQRIPPA